MLYYVTEINPTEVINVLPLLKRKRGRVKRGESFVYKNVICAFDIETSRIKTGEHDSGTFKKPHIIEDFISIMYIWQFQIGNEFTVYGRTWEEFNSFILELVNGLNENERLMIYVHNLAYEFQFIRDRAVLGEHIDPDSVFSVKARTPIKFTAFGGKLEFRCSYILSNMSLEMFTAQMHVEHGKLSGDEFDYEKTRYAWTELTPRELEYCVNDVQGLVEAVQKRLELGKDTLYTIPLTSTGYVRRDMKSAIYANLPYDYVKKLLPDYPLFQMLRQAFRGGNTHASRFYSGKMVEGDIKAYDIASSYPNVMINRKFPMTPFRHIEKRLRVEDIDDYTKRGRCLLMRVGLWNVRLRNKYWAVPYLSKDKCWNILNADYDNGRIISADYVELSITDIDYKILLEEYDFELIVSDAYFATYGYLPDCVRDVIRKYYVDKTRLRGVEEEREMYDISKALLNSCYGMMAQCPVKTEYLYDVAMGEYIEGAKYHRIDGEMGSLSLEEAREHDIDIYEMLLDENGDKATMPYQWGVWVTAHARYHLEQALKICGDRFLYCDTDSVYYIDDPIPDFSPADFRSLNRQSERESKKNGACAVDIKGREHPMGVFELDKEAVAFKTFGAKKYAYIDKGAKLHITIAGVNKKKGSDELERYAVEHGLKNGLEALRTGFVFTDAGGTESVYNDYSIPDFEVNGWRILVPSNVVIKPSTYKVGLSEDYEALIDFLFENDLWGLYRLNFENAQLPSIEI